MRLLAGRYRLEEKISSGKTGAAYRAVDDETGRTVVVKSYDSDAAGDDFKQRVFKKARAAAALTHPNVTTVHDFGDDDGVPFVVMELVQGIDLVHLLELEREGSLTPERAILIHGQIVAALQYARSAGVAHGPVRPENVIIGERDKVSVTLPLGLSNTDAPTKANMTESLRRSLEALSTSAPTANDTPPEVEKDGSQTIWPIPGGRYDPARLGRRVIFILVLLALVALAAFIWRVTSEVDKRRENPPSISPSAGVSEGFAPRAGLLGAKGRAGRRVTLLASGTEDDGVPTSDATGAEPDRGTGTGARARVTITVEYEGVGDGALFDRGLQS